MKRAGKASSWLIGFALIALLLQFAASSVAHASPSEDGFAQKINEERSRRGIPALAYDSGLLDIARTHSKRMADSGRLYHNTGLPGQVGDWEAIGENVGRGPDVGAIHEAFMSSPSHRSQILSSDYFGYASGFMRRTRKFGSRNSSFVAAPSRVPPPLLSQRVRRKRGATTVFPQDPHLRWWPNRVRN